MADITDPQVIKFANEHIRPLAEQLRDFKAYLDDAAATYQAEIAGLLTPHANGDMLADSREGRGVSRLSKADINGFLAELNSLKSALEAAGVMDTIRKPCVRPLRS